MNETRVGADVGGTFTDLVTVTDGRLAVDKTPSTPAEPEQGVLNGVDELSLTPSAVSFFGHGTTVATNAVLEGEWADTGLVTTAGFRDVLEIGRQTRPDIYDFTAEKPDPVVPRDRRFEVPERIDERGAVIEPLDESAVRAVGERLRESDADSVAVATLFSFENDRHERRIAELLREGGVEASLSLSSDVLPEIREYERTLATALNAGLKPVMDAYLGALADGLTEREIEAPLRIMGSNGGLLAESAARERPVTTLLSGPAAGVRGAVYAASRAGTGPGDATAASREITDGQPNQRADDEGYTDLLTMDMGGTSCDVSLVRDGEPTLSTETTVGEYPVSVPTVDIHTVGAGGGSIAHVDDGGALRVGPASAGADPGPVCYGRGGTEPTVTDAQVLLGRIDPSAFLADELSADRAAVREAFEPLAAELDTSVREAAAGVVSVADAATERALRVVSVERGFDPRTFTLVAFGGAGPLHAAGLAERLDVPEVIVPRAAGVLSALGLLVSDVTYEYAASMVRPLESVDAGTLAERFREFERAGREELADSGHEPRFERAVDLRYAGQSFDLRVPVSETLDADTLATVRERFHERHRRRYGHADPEEPVELVAVRLQARGVVEPPELAYTGGDGSLADAQRARRPVVFERERDTPVYDRARLPVGAAFDGPAVIEGADTTVVVHPGQRVRVDSAGNLVIDTAASGETPVDDGTPAGGTSTGRSGATNEEDDR